MKKINIMKLTKLRYIEVERAEDSGRVKSKQCNNPTLFENSLMYKEDM